MKLSELWLREWVDLPEDIYQTAHQLTLSGFEIESIEDVAPDFSQVVVGQISQLEKHPNADKLNLCQVNVGGDEPLSIICGAANARAGLKVAVAVIGAVLPGNFAIKKAKLRGVESFGMLCSAKELGLAETASGIIELPEDAPIGTPIRDYLQLDDHILDISITPNRGDCLSVLGMAREIAAEQASTYRPPEILPSTETITETLSVALNGQKGCLRYVGRVIKNIHSQAKTPVWLQERLRRSGLRPVHLVVDIMNYVMLEFGQPMHAFDLEKISKSIQVRFAKPDEKLTLLTGETVTLNSSALLIADDQKPLALAGVMGGLDSSITEQTQNIFLESAFFDPAVVFVSSRKGTNLRLQSDSSFRFERGVDYKLQRLAIERATQLLLELAGGDVGPIADEQLPDSYTEKTSAFDLSQIKALLGIEIPSETVEAILKRLGFEVEKQEPMVWQVTVPSFRFDIPSNLVSSEEQNTDEELIVNADLVEEIARIYGYDKIPAQSLCASGGSARSTFHLTEKRLRHCLQDQGYHEVVTYSFVDEDKLRLVDPHSSFLTLSNPIIVDFSTMRTTLWLNLLETLKYNLHRQVERLKIFELGSCYWNKSGDSIEEERVISGLVYGSVFPEQWSENNRLADFFDVKGDIESLLSLYYPLADFSFSPTTHHALHPGKSAAILRNGQEIGKLGMLHPQLASQLDLPDQIGLFEIKLNTWASLPIPQGQPISKFPAVHRDIAIVVDAQISIADIEHAIYEAGGDLLVNLVVFDVYQGEGIPKDKKSLAFRLTFQQVARTLNVEEVNEVVDHVLKLLENKFTAILRN